MRLGKKITFYAVLNKREPSKFLTFTLTKKQAIEYGNKFLKAIHMEHFKQWCEYHNLNADMNDSWNIYFMKCLTADEKREIVINKIGYKWEDMTAILRMFGGCVPLGCSFDTPQEYSYLNLRLETHKKLTEDLLKKVQDIVDESEKQEVKTEPDA